MAKQTPTEVKLEFICREIRELKEETKSLRADLNKGKGGLLVLLFIGTFISGLYNYFK
tara:strand:- start:265 stop:438 length:174 start_codon:yes stop_codon:yes gene_type:complete